MTEYNKNLPTKKILDFARDIAKRLSIPLPPECETDFKACCNFVDTHKEKLPPSDAQLAAVRVIQKNHKVKAEADVFTSATKASEFIKKYNKL